jgi:biopolymer transport protein ExbB/TolQ
VIDALHRAWVWFAAGGPVMVPLALCGAAAYAILFNRLHTRDTTGSLTMLRALVAATPLLGLLGKVTGITGTFDAIAAGQPGTAAGAGIAQALRTTQFGLAMAGPALLAERWLTRLRERGATREVTA